MVRTIESPPTVAFRRGTWDTWRFVREVFGATLIVAVWAALWMVTVAAALQPWAPDSPPQRAAVAQRG